MNATVVASTHQAITKEIREFFFTYSDLFFPVILTLLESLGAILRRALPIATCRLKIFLSRCMSVFRTIFLN